MTVLGSTAGLAEHWVLFHTRSWTSLSCISKNCQNERRNKEKNLQKRKINLVTFERKSSYPLSGGAVVSEAGQTAVLLAPDGPSSGVHFLL